MATLDCQICGAPVKVDPRAAACTCYLCVIETMWGAAPKTEKKKVGYPKGWRFMKEFVHADGTVFHKGVEQPELKGSLPITEIIVKPKKSAKQKAEEKAEAINKIAKLKKQLKSEQRKTQQKKLETQIKKLQTKL
jgi:hypothetical protein